MRLLILVLILLYSPIVFSPERLLCISTYQKFPKFTKREIKCLAENIYHEARGESEEGMIAVANVVANRYKSGLYPKDICKIVHQYKQFSWTIVMPSIKDAKSYKHVYKLTSDFLLYGWHLDITKGSLHFHHASVRPYWSRSMTIKRIIDNHFFY